MLALFRKICDPPSLIIAIFLFLPLQGRRVAWLLLMLPPGYWERSQAKKQRSLWQVQ